MGGRTYQVTAEDITEYIDKRRWNELALYDFALHSGINIIANALSACEVRTIIGKRYRKTSIINGITSRMRI